MRRGVLAGLTALLASGAMAASPTGLDPLSASIEAEDARRFAAVFKAQPALPTESQLAKQYLAGAGLGVQVFTPHRIVSAANLAQAVAADPARYRHAIDQCLPLLPGLEPELRAVYLAYRGLLPERPLPAIHVVFGAGNSGGTAEAGIQVLGLEVMCGPGTTPDAFRRAMRDIFAHETVHSWQPAPEPAALADLMALMVLREGVPEYLASLVTGQRPNPERERWGLAREAELWAEFQRDRKIVRAGTQGNGQMDERAQAAFKRWFQNFGSAPEGWPSEAGYWLGMRIAEAYVAQAADQRAALRELIDVQDAPALILRSGYRGGSAVPLTAPK